MTESAQSGSEVWSVIAELAHLDKNQKFAEARILDKQPDLEACLRRVLRPHDEAGFRSSEDEWMIDLRLRLDDALEALTYLEIREQLKLSNEELPSDIKDSLRILFRSEAFLRYLNAYLYFGIRFLANRNAFRSTPDGEESLSRAEMNVLSLPLCIPPPLLGYLDAEELFGKFIAQAGPESYEIAQAFLFLDDFHQTPKPTQSVQYELREPSQYELWLRGLRPETDGEQARRFESIRQGMAKWAISRSEFYLSLSPQQTVRISSDDGEASKFEEQNARPTEGWIVTHPMAARFALSDIYWIARLLRADVSDDGSVTYKKYSWLHLLRFHALLVDDKDLPPMLEKAEEALRSVFGYVCDLIQNSAELTHEDELRKAEADKADPPPDQTIKWRAVFDEELDEIAKQRRVRRFRDPSRPLPVNPSRPPGWDVPVDPIVWPSTRESSGISRNEANAPAKSSKDRPDPQDCNAKGWSKRITVEEESLLRARIGLAFSGGGIRSATFNLGVLQGLQELDLLRDVDYLSTVSGGGFIGSWLVANVRRSTYWLGRLTDWTDSINHLRDYSNYLAPRTGILSADTWNLANSWFRNAFLIQLTSLAWLFVLLLATDGVLRIFQMLGPATIFGLPLAAVVAFSMGMLLTGIILYNLHGLNLGTAAKSRGSHWVRLLAVTPASIGSYALSAHLWANSRLDSQAWPNLLGLDQYSKLFLAAWRPWLFILSSAGAAFLVIAFVTIKKHKIHALWICTVCTLVLYLELVGIFLLLRSWNGSARNELAFVFGPAIVLMAFAVCVLLLIGFTGRNTDEDLREWWTRFGTWLTIFGGVSIFVSAVAIFGPWLILMLFKPHDHQPIITSIKWTSVLSWLGTVIGALFAGKSSKTSGEGEATNSPALEILANIGGFLFIIGSFVLGSTLLYLLMFEMFAVETSLKCSCYFNVLAEFNSFQIPVALLAALVIGSTCSWFFEINIFGLNQFYRNRLVRGYLGASRWTPGLRKPNPFTKFDFKDDLELWRFRTDFPQPGQAGNECDPYRGPFPIVNCTLNLAGSADLKLNSRHSSSFSLTPLRCGSDRPRVGYAPTWSKEGCFADKVTLGQAVAISGAAVTSNMGYNTSPLVAFLLTMFNVRLGWWFPNPGQDAWRRKGLSFSLYYLVMELLGIANDNRYFLNTSDGGHFENLGIYELVRRRCKLIIACDAECDEALQFGGLGNVIRICETDFGAVIDIDVKSIRPQADGLSITHCAVGEIKYSSGDIGRLIYLKASMTGDEGVSIAQYRSSHPSFPHESTANQFFSEDQFESYRSLGLHVVRASFKGSLPGDDPLSIAEKMADILTPAGGPTESLLKHSKSLENMWEKFRGDPNLLAFMKELTTHHSQTTRPTTVENDELCIGLELFQIMEDVFLDLRLDDYWEHPDNRGWAILFMRWARSPRLRMIWEDTRRTFGIRFEYFCEARLGLQRDHPIARV
jgi:Patatin-like phospholipase